MPMAASVRPWKPQLRAPAPRFARPRANPTLMTIELIAQALQRAAVPVSRNDLLAQLREWGHGTNRRTLNAALSYLFESRAFGEGSKGIVHIPLARGKALEAIREGERL